MNDYYFRGYVLKGELIASLTRYVEEGVPCGGFLTAALENNFKVACMCADDRNIQNLPALASFIYDHMPFACQGSPEKVNAWIERGGQNGDN